jgi:hypothetical protein
VPLVVAGTCECNASPYYLWQSSTRTWLELDWGGWQQELAKRLPPGLTNMNGFWPDLANMTAEGSLWRKEDPHCCPTGGTVQVDLGVADRSFVLRSFRTSTAPWREPKGTEPRPRVMSQAISPSVFAWWLTHAGSDGSQLLDVLVLWRGQPGWSLQDMESSTSFNRASVDLEARFGTLDLRLSFHAAAHSVQIQGRPHPLVDGNVVLVDQVDSAGGPTTVAIRTIDSRLPGSDGSLVPVFQASEELRTFLRCGAPSDRALLRLTLCGKVAPKI